MQVSTFIFNLIIIASSFPLSRPCLISCLPNVPFHFADWHLSKMSKYLVCENFVSPIPSPRFISHKYIHKYEWPPLLDSVTPKTELINVHPNSFSFHPQNKTSNYLLINDSVDAYYAVCDSNPESKAEMPASI